MNDLELFDYRNLFPLNRTASFVLTLMYLCPFPFSRTSLLHLLKPLCSDKEAASLLNILTKGGYLYEEYHFFALTSKSIICLDIYKEKSPHRKRGISVENLSAYEIKSYIVAQTLVNRVIPVIQNQGRWSKSEIERKEIIQKMIQQIQNREVPFVQKYNTAIYSQTISKTRYLREYDINSLYLSKLHSQLNASAIKAKSDPREAENYERINKELLQVKSALEKITPLCQMFTYENGFKVLTLSILEYNNLFIEQLTDNSITFGFINSAAKSITNYILRKKLDYAITFAATLGLELSVNIYTTEHNRFILERRLQKLKTPFILPAITIITVPDKLPTRTEFLNQILDNN